MGPKSAQDEPLTSAYIAFRPISPQDNEGARLICRAPRCVLASDSLDDTRSYGHVMIDGLSLL
jgi:hypothetical protein